MPLDAIDGGRFDATLDNDVTGPHAGFKLVACRRVGNGDTGGAQGNR
ncbi:hypothetical protein [Halomonas garicola]|nr:hypothetical protein [Halomonas garicola]